MVYSGRNEIIKIYHGQAPICRLYKGNTLVFLRDTILKLNRAVPAADVIKSYVVANVYDGTGTRTYKWNTTLPVGRYTLRFNTDGNTEPDVVTCDIDETKKLVLEWKDSTDRWTKLYVSTTELYVEYKYNYYMSGTEKVREYYADKFITSVEII